MNALILIFYKIAAFFTSILSKTRKNKPSENTDKIKDLLNISGPYINDQHMFSDISYGVKSMSFNGCGPIALYNALKSFDLTPDLDEILTYLEKNGAAFGARFGTSPYAISKFLKNKGFRVIKCKSTHPDTLNSFSDEFDTFISVIYNDAHSLKKGLHFICTQRNGEGRFISHNPLFTSDTLFGALSLDNKKPIRNLCTLGISKTRK